MTRFAWKSSRQALSARTPRAMPVTPDLTTMGKVIGGGLPVGAYGGRKDIMEQVSPAGPIYQAGTLSGNPLAMAAGLAMLNGLFEDPAVFDRIEEAALQIGEGLFKAAARHGIEGLVVARDLECSMAVDRGGIDPAGGQHGFVDLFEPRRQAR